MKDSSALAHDVRPVPPRAVGLSAAALAVPVASAFFFPETQEEHAALLWLLALVPAFLLAYHKGWRGIALSLGADMAALSLTHGALSATGRVIQDRAFIIVVILFYVGLSLGIGYFTEILRRERLLAERRALTDDLTELPNRRFARLILERGFAGAQRGLPLTVVAFDLDGFKAFNDRHGHAAGDEALRVFGRVLSTVTRRADFSARYGGEEFVSALSSTDLAGTLQFVARVRAELVREAKRLAAPLTVSAGVVTYGRGYATVDELLADADRALYAAKAAGRDGVRVVDPAAPERVVEPELLEAAPA